LKSRWSHPACRNMEAARVAQTAADAGWAVSAAGTNANLPKSESTPGPCRADQLVEARSTHANTDAFAAITAKVSHGKRCVTASARRGIILRGAPVAGGRARIAPPGRAVGALGPD
jgi:hypothetical protein